MIELRSPLQMVALICAEYVPDHVHIVVEFSTQPLSMPRVEVKEDVRVLTLDGATDAMVELEAAMVEGMAEAITLDRERGPRFCYMRDTLRRVIVAWKDPESG